MKNFFLTACLAVGVVSGNSATKSPQVDHVEPPYWWTGMANDTVQLMVYGAGIKDARLNLDYPGVKVVEIADLDGSPDDLVAYLSIDDSAKPGTVNLMFENKKGKKQSVPFELKSRTWQPADAKGFDASDVLYLIMPDRFADGDPSNNDLPEKMKAGLNATGADRSKPNARHGGDIKGMSDNLDYIEDLGVTAIWVNPVLTNNQPGGSYHGYATTDYYNIDPRFGTNDEWREFVDKAHGKGMKVVMDMIFNHCGSEHLWLKNPPASDWFNHQKEFEEKGEYVITTHKKNSLFDPYASDIDKDLAVNGWFVPSMPDLNQLNPHVMNYLIQNSIFWIEDSHIDGIRMDTYPYADKNQMARWIDAVEKEYPNFNIVGECWYDGEAPSAYWQRATKLNDTDPRLKTVMDFLYANGGKRYFYEDSKGNEGLNRIYEHLSMDFLYPDPQKILTFLDNHDTDRFLSEDPSDLKNWKQAMALLLTSRGIPQLYYGSEVLMSGTRAEGGDANVRRDMSGGFPGDSISVFTREGRDELQNEAYDYLSKLLNWRKSNPANDVIASGKMTHFAPYNGIYVYSRRLGDKSVIVILNGTDEDALFDASRYTQVLDGNTGYTDAITGDKIQPDNLKTLPPRASLILTNF